jgi:hypothetical protein
LEYLDTDRIKEPGNEIIIGFNQMLIQQMQKGLNYIYRGSFTPNINESILSLFESSLDDHESVRQVKRKVYSIMVEGLQNATMHQANIADKKSENKGIFILRKEIFSYFIITGNIVSNEEKNDLVEKIRQVNFLGLDKIETQHKKILFESAKSDSGGEALGLIEMARISGNKFLYSFKKIDPEFSYFYLLTELPSRQQDKRILESDNALHFDYLPSLHESLDRENIMLVFNSLLNQESIVNLISFVEKEIDESAMMKKRLYNLMIEMIQNIIMHGSGNQHKDNSQPSIFYISQNDESFFLHTGNYIENDKIDKLSKNIDEINNMDSEGLNQYYSKKLFNFEKENEKGPGLGICDIRIKSGNMLEYHFARLNDEYSFFIFKVKITKS